MRSKFKNPARAAAVAVATLMVIGVGVVLGQSPFSDVRDDDPRLGDITYVASQNWFRGYPDGSFRPDRQITEDQLARVIRRAHPGLTRGDAAVFLRGGMERLREAGIAPIATTTRPVATTAPIADTGGPGAGGPVDPNPPVVNEGPTTTTTTTTTLPAPDGIGERNLIRYGYETGWMDDDNQNGSLFWMEFAIADYRSPQDFYLRNWWRDNGFVKMTLTGTDENGRTQKDDWDQSEDRIMFVPYAIESVTIVCGISQGCAAPESGLANTDAVRWANQQGFTKPAPPTATTTTTTVPPTTAVTAPSTTTTTTTAPEGQTPTRTLAYGKEDGWVSPSPRRVAGNIVWWEHRNWGSATLKANLVMSYGGTVSIAADDPRPYWHSLREEAFTIASASCTAPCNTLEASMPESIRNRLIADGFTPPGG